MQDLAAWVIIFAAGFSLLITIAVNSGDNEWGFFKSPESGVCYEVRTTLLGPWFGESMAPVDDKWCERREK